MIGTAALDGSGNAIDNTGNFTVSGSTFINGTTGIGIEVTDDKSNVTFNGGIANTPMIDNRGNIGIEILANKGPVIFNGTTTIANENAVTRPAVDIRRNQDLNAIVRFNKLDVENATGPAAFGFGGIGVNIGGTNIIDANAAQVVFNELDIGLTQQATNGTALFVANEGMQTVTQTGNQTTGLIIGRGSIFASGVISGTGFTTGGTAVDISNSVMQVSLTRVSSTNAADFGISLVDNQSFRNIAIPTLNDFMFSVVGSGNNAQRLGGNIILANTAAVRLLQTKANLVQTGDVSLSQVTLDNNRQGIVARDLLQLAVTDSDISLNTRNGITAIDIPRVDIITSLFNLNGSTVADNAIHLTATKTLPVISPTNGVYNWNITDNINLAGLPAAGFTGSFAAGDLVVVDSSRLLQVLNTANQTVVTPLVFNFDRNSETVQASTVRAASGVAVNWIGLESGSINANQILLRGGDRGISIANTDTTFLTNFQILGNTVNAIGGSNVGIFVNNFGPTDLLIGSLRNLNQTVTPSTFTFTTPVQAFANVTTNDIAMEFSIVNALQTTRSNINIFDNDITMTGPNTNQGIVFTTVQAPATLTFDNNRISVDVRPNAPFAGMGIDIQSIIGTANLRGTFNNRITTNGINTLPNNAGVVSQDWVRINGATTGQFVVNGFVGP